MTVLRQGVDFAVDLFTSAMWALAVFFIAARLLSGQAGVLLAIAVFITAMTYALGSRLQERRASRLAAGSCPRCQAALTIEHEHRRWDPANQEWLAPLMTWRCRSCDFQQEVALACERCPVGA